MTSYRPGGKRPRLRLLHTSDVHLGAHDSSASTGGASGESLRDGFRRVIDIGLEERVDLFLIAGDFFDNARVHMDTMHFAAEQIARLGVPTVIGPGNHDHVGPGSVYDRFDLTTIAQNLRLMRALEGETVAFDDLEVEVWGRSHTEQVLDFQPFENAPPRGDAAWQLGIGHGHYIHPQARLHNSFHIREHQLAAAERDYVALGHWEKMTRVASGEVGVAAYSGAPEALSGMNGGFVMIVDLLEDGEVRLTAVPVEDGHPRIHHDDLPLLPGLR